MAEFVKYLGKSKQLPLGLYEIFPEFFQIKEETTKEKQGEGSGILLNPEHPPIVGEELPDWDGEKARGGATRRVREEPEAAPPAAPDPASPRRPGESTRAYNLRMAKSMGFDTVAEMWEEFPDLEKETKKEQRAEAARLKGPGRPPGPPKP